MTLAPRFSMQERIKKVIYDVSARVKYVGKNKKRSYMTLAPGFSKYERIINCHMTLASGFRRRKEYFPSIKKSWGVFTIFIIVVRG